MSTDTLERELINDLERLEERFADDEFSTDLYRALTNNVIRKQDGPDGHVSLSWSRAEEIVNGFREKNGRAALELAQTGGEGEVSDLVRDELGRRGWSFAPLNTSRHDDEHEGRPESPPPRDGESPEWERQAHAEASANELR
jgi:hypothetical protein